MKSLWNGSYEESKIRTPKEIIEEQCEELVDMTFQKIIGRIREYDGEIRSYSIDPFGIAMKGISAAAMMKKNFDVQNELGEIGDESILKYEFYITSRKTPNYKYRAFFIQHSIGLYPVVFVIDKSISDELKIQTEVTCADEIEFVKLLSSILSSNRIFIIINNLLALNKD